MWQKITTRLALFGVLCTSVWLWAAVIVPGRTAAAPFTCEVGFYQMLAGQLTILHPETGEYANIGSPGPSNLSNALGYNVEDNYLYAIRNDVGFEGALIRIHEDGSVDDLGVPTGLPTDTSYIAGDFDDSGNLYVREFANSNEVWVIDVSANTASVLNLSANIFVSEMVYLNGVLYGVMGQNYLYRIDTADGTVTNPTISGLPNDVGFLEGFGAGWRTVGGRLYFSRNSTGVIYRIDDYTTGSPTATPVLQGAIPFNNDGASCPNARSAILELMAADDTTSVTAGNTLTINASSGVLTNDQGDSITVTDFTQPANGTVSVNADGSFTYIPDEGFSGTDSFAYTITDTFGLTATATVTITVSPAAVSSEKEETLADTGSWQSYSLAGSAVLLAVGVLIIVRRHLV